MKSLIQFNDSQLSILKPEYNLILKELSWSKTPKLQWINFLKKINKELIDCYFYDFVPSLMRSESLTGTVKSKRTKSCGRFALSL